MAKTYSVLLGHVNRSGPFDVVLYQASAVATTVVRDLVVNVVTTTTVSFSIYYLSGGVQFYLVRAIAEDSKPFHLELRQVLPPDAELHVSCAGDLWTCLVTGYELAP